MKSTPQPLDGILLLDKSLGMTSNAALQKVKKLFNAKKAGHTGSLDPLATGMLPICFGEATKFSQFLLEADKYYQVEVQLGITTTTGDAEGHQVTARPLIDITSHRVEQVLTDMKGTLDQIPPMFSAIKQNGTPLYKLARQGIVVERRPRTIQLYSLELTEWNEATFCFTVKCSKGTYIRALVEEIGARLGCGAYVKTLRRPVVAPYEHYPLYTLAMLEERYQYRGQAGLIDCLLPIETSVYHLPTVTLSAVAGGFMQKGRPVAAPDLPKQACVRLYADSLGFIGVGEVLDDGRVAPKRLLNAE